MIEIWRPVPGYPDYEVSNEGSVRSLKYGKTRIMSLTKSEGTGGYVQLGLCRNGEIRVHKVHRLVAMAFVPNPEGKPEVAHVDGVRDNNNAGNLRWSTTQENQDDRQAHGTSTRRVQGKLNSASVHDIRSRYDQGDVTQKALAEQYRVDPSLVSRVVNGKRWTF